MAKMAFVLSGWHAAPTGGASVLSDATCRRVTGRAASGWRAAPARVVCTAAQASPTTAYAPTATEDESVYVCAECRAPLPPSMLSCPNCQATYRKSDEYIDRVPKPTNQQTDLLAPFVSLLDPNRVRQDLFRLPLVSFLYERGWRANFKTYGFIGEEGEYDLLMQYFEETGALRDGKRSIALDLSCGSGFMTRRMVRSDRFRRVIAMDFSESMLRETRRRVVEERVNLDTLDVVRADVGRLPLADNSMDAIVNGAAVHCYLRVQDGLREMYRVLRPGGALFGTTISNRVGAQSVIRYYGVDELRWLLIGAGFKDPDIEQVGNAALIFRAQK